MSGKISLKKAWEVLLPYLLYYLAYNAAYLILAFLYQASTDLFGGAYGAFMTAYAVNVTGVMGGLAMLIGILPLVPMLKEELRGRGETFCFKRLNAAGGLTVMVNPPKRRMEIMTALTVIFAVSASLGLNALFALTDFAENSQTYREVADRQYGVAFALGLVLYGLISPFTEEVVFRGVIYNRLRRFYSPVIGMIASGILFGVIHGNLVQGIYGACLGMLMAYLYERSGRFLIPFLFHAAANLAVYTTARMEGVQERLFTPVGCAVLLAVSAGCVLAERRVGRT